ncbi:uncharacterized protein LOC116431847 [Nomia melanderi]|uniref:uncharacterized protein LOC116431847 n=1 Tax=Nomia melanderi TaxID=2448451 RepID=UPI0013040413|nr:homeobox protein MSH-A-like [Nomia melanderi]
MKDFSIQSILADTAKHKTKSESTDLVVPGKRINLTRLKRHLCITDNSMKTVDGGECSGRNSRRISNIGTEDEQFFIQKLYINFEQETFDIIDEEENLATLRERKCKRNDGEPSEGVTQTKIDLCEGNGAEITEEYGAKGKVKSRSFGNGVRCKNENEHSLSEDSMDDHQRRSSSRKVKTSKIKYEGNSGKNDHDRANCLNETRGSRLLENQYERLKDDEKSIVQSDCLLANDAKKNINDFFKDGTESLQELRSELEWLHCTRYKPPKVPRRSRTDQHKRKASLHPRIPFSSYQIDVLERRFHDSAYVSKNDVLDLSAALTLPPKKVKIWFQNRRARERRESHGNL